MGVYGFVLGGGDGGVWPSISPDGGCWRAMMQLLGTF